MRDTHQNPANSPCTGASYDPATAVLFGQLIEAAYTMYNAQPNNATPPPSSNFPSGYRFVAWIQMQDFIIESTGLTFYGFVAQSVAEPNLFVMAIRGTSTWVEWWDDLNAIQLTPFKDPGSGLVGAGFARIYDTLEVVLPPTAALTESAAPRSLKSAGGFSKQISALLSQHAGAARTEALPPPASIAVTGHSLGAALATLYVMDNALTDRIHNPLIYTFASPRVGDSTFASAFNALSLSSWRIDNLPDIVPQLPLGFTHVDTLKQYDSRTTVWPSPSCWHALATYLSLIDANLKPDPGCQWSSLTAAPPARVAPPSAAFAPAAPPAAITRSVPAGPVTVNITINVGARD